MTLRATCSQALFAPRLTTARGLPTSRRDGHRVRRGAPRGARASGTRAPSIMSLHHSGTQGMSVVVGTFKRCPTAIRSVSWSDTCERASTSSAAADQRGCERVRSVDSTVAAVRHYSRTVSSSAFRAPVYGEVTARIFRPRHVWSSRASFFIHVKVIDKEYVRELGNARENESRGRGIACMGSHAHVGPCRDGSRRHRTTFGIFLVPPLRKLLIVSAHTRPANPSSEVKSDLPRRGDNLDIDNKRIRGLGHGSRVETCGAQSRFDRRPNVLDRQR